MWVGGDGLLPQALRRQPPCEREQCFGGTPFPEQEYGRLEPEGPHHGGHVHRREVRG